jgi:hypothetical protein
MSVAAGFAQKRKPPEIPAATDRTSTDYADYTDARTAKNAKVPSPDF